MYLKKTISASLLVKGKDHVEMGLKDVVTRKCMVKNKEAMRQDKVATVKGISVTTSEQAADSAECRVGCEEEGECRYWEVLEVLGECRYWVSAGTGGIGSTGGVQVLDE